MPKQKQKIQFVYTTCSELVVFIYWTGKSMDIRLSYCGLVDARKRASDKDLPVQNYIYLDSLHV
jgi:predicted DNA binding CopG/RHH family protein